MSSFEEVISFFETGSYTTFPNIFRAENRSEINSRLLTWTQNFQKMGSSPSRAAILSAVIGELANNSFDHNLGKWHDQTGCIVGIDELPDRYRVSVSDRGQGIASSLRWIRPQAKDNSELLKCAFEEVVSGRSPEKRGNGLKFVCRNFRDQGGLSLVCLSSNSRYVLGSESTLDQVLTGNSSSVGTLVAIDWSQQ